MELQEYFTKGIDFNEYIEIIKNDTNNSLYDYTKLNLARINRLEKTFKLSEEQIKKIKQITSTINCICITEGWCGDAANILPVIHEIAKQSEKITIKYIFRDNHTELMEKYLTNGNKSIPIYIICDENFQEINSFGPRTQFGMQLLHKMKTDENYKKEEFYIDLQKYYIKDKGKDIVTEFIDKIS
ncbi:MAG: thioredoxin family protein [Flavobacteriales bacterium]|nr:thioredoxin family protein [Flavobacteriales bacterium]